MKNKVKIKNAIRKNKKETPHIAQQEKSKDNISMKNKLKTNNETE